MDKVSVLGANFFTDSALNKAVCIKRSMKRPMPSNSAGETARLQREKPWLSQTPSCGPSILDSLGLTRPHFARRSDNTIHWYAGVVSSTGTPLKCQFTMAVLTA